MHSALRPPRIWLVRAALVFFLASYAALAIGSAFDRLAHERPALSGWVPDVLQAATPSARARRFVAAGLAAPALEPARAALRADPVDPANSALVGTALLARGDRNGAERAFRVAARLGWREPLTQLYWLETALAAGDTASAVLRFDVLARQYPNAPAMLHAATRLEASAAGREALAERMARGANWSASYAAIDAAAGQDRVAARGAVLLAAAQRGLRLGCEPIARITRSLADFDPTQGAALWRAHCPEVGGAGAVVDGSFESFVPTRQRVPFEWNLVGNGDLSARLVAPGEGQAGRGQALELSNGGAMTIPVIAQLLPLAPGRYRLTWSGESGGRLRAELGCAREPTTPPTAEGRGQEFAIDGSCPARWLRFWLAPGTAAARLDDVALERL